MTKAGGQKGMAIVETIRNDTEKQLSRKAIARLANCTVGRVGETIRYLATNGTDNEKQLVAYLVAPTHSTESNGKSVAKAGGQKGMAIVETIRNDTEKQLTRKGIAELSNCTVGRVGETVRYLASNGTDEEKQLVAYLVAPIRTVQLSLF